MIDITRYQMIFDLNTGDGRAKATARLEALEHDKKALEKALDAYKETLLKWMDREGFIELEAGNRTWKAVTREQNRLNNDLVKDFCKEIGKDIAELKKVQTSHYFQLCK